jgi:MFS family permease
MEDVSDLIGRGFRTWRDNLNLCLPYLLNVVLSVAIIVPITAALAGVISPLENLNLTSVEDVQDQLPILKETLPALVGAFILLIFLMSMISAFFTAGAIGMAKQALEMGKTTLGAMWSSGRKHFVNMFLANIILGIITAAGLLFLLPGIVLLPTPIQPEPQAMGILLIGLVLLVLYALAMSIILAAAPYALVVDALDPIGAVRAGVKFFRYNKFDVFVIWLVILAISLGLQMIGGVFSTGNAAGLQPLSIVTGIVNLLALSPLSTVWWTRLYMDRTEKLKVSEKENLW